MWYRFLGVIGLYQTAFTTLTCTWRFLRWAIQFVRTLPTRLLRGRIILAILYGLIAMARPSAPRSATVGRVAGCLLLLVAALSLRTSGKASSPDMAKFSA